MRHFTVEEANALLPTLIPVLHDLRAQRTRMEEAVKRVRSFERRAGQNGHGDLAEVLDPDHDLSRIRDEIEQRLNFLQGLGVHLKNIENGIVDFPTQMFGGDVYLCWRLGEESVSHWHGMETGFAGRKPLP
ncbi:MAG TPA: DUF2203 domain-containing protein [Chloroflexota bacterium]|nr:DUF2203 domain-containing protein [Chloroflexota bacterium]